MVVPLVLTDKAALVTRAKRRMDRFCAANSIEAPELIVVPKQNWYVHACGYYRPQVIRVCLEKCGWACGHENSRNWSWPGSTIDRTVYGVICHELGHHCDWIIGKSKGKYYSEYCQEAKDLAKEPGLTSYANENHAEWLAEAIRLFVTNHALLKVVRPRTWQVLRDRWIPVSGRDWIQELGANVPARVVKANHNKIGRL